MLHTEKTERLLEKRSKWSFLSLPKLSKGSQWSFSTSWMTKENGGMFLGMKTPFGTVPFDTLSQGTQSIVHSLARFILGYAEFYDFPPNLQDKPGILIIDEIDAHLHPSWQRQVIPTLTRNFPNLQIFCSTHSPMMLAGLKEGQVHLLKPEENGKITVSRNESSIVGWTADEILRNFLEVPNPTDIITAGNVVRLPGT